VLLFIFVSTLFPPKMGILPTRKRGITSTLNNSKMVGYFWPEIFKGCRPGCPQFFETPPDPEGPLVLALDPILSKKCENVTCLGSRLPSRGLYRLEEGGGSFFVGNLGPSQIKLQQKKFPTFCVDVIPSPLSSYGVSALFPLPIFPFNFDAF
jgi:hypothetical protein